MRPPRVELGSREPESHVRSITLRARQQILYYLKQKELQALFENFNQNNAYIRKML